jgi:hypothetical protein
MARDARRNFGAIALAVKDVDVVSADTIDFGASSLAAAVTGAGAHRSGLLPDQVIVFHTPAAFVAGDGAIPYIEDSADGLVWAKIQIGPEITAPAAGIFHRMQMPMRHRQHMRAGCTPKSAGVFTASVVNAWIEFGET